MLELHGIVPVWDMLISGCPDQCFSIWLISFVGVSAGAVHQRTVILKVKVKGKGGGDQQSFMVSSRGLSQVSAARLREEISGEGKQTGGKQ